MVADVKFPREYDKDVDINTVISEILENLSATFAREPAQRNQGEDRIPGQPTLSEPAILAPVAAVGPVAERAQQQHDEQDQEQTRGPRWRGRRSSPTQRQKSPLSLSLEEGQEAQMIPPSVVIELDVRLKDIKASMPIFTRELSYSSYALARPVVAFMNAHKTLIPVHCRIVMDLVCAQPNPRANSMGRWTSRRPVSCRLSRARFTRRWRTTSRRNRRIHSACAT